MPSRSRDVRVRLLSESDDKGFKSAEASAKVLERELNKLEQSQRRMASLHMAASREMAAAEAAKANAVVTANQRQGEAMDAFGRKVLLGTAAAAAGMGLAAKAAMNWESAWAGVTKTVNGSPEQMAALEAELRGLAKVLPATHEEIAGVAEAAGQLGVAREDITAFTRTMINMGETTNLSADEAATSIAQFSNIMGTGHDQAAQLGAAIVALGNDGASTERDIMSMGLRIAGAGRTAGLTAPQVLAVASALSSVGIEAEAGGSAISRVMTQIESDVTSGKDTVQEYARVAGMSASEFADKWQTDAAGALTSFIQGLGTMQQQGQDTTAVLDELGFSDIRVADTLRRASLAGDLLADSIKTGSRAFEENIALIAEANKRYQTTEARLQMARNQINDAAIDIGANLLPAVAAGSEKVGALATAFGSLSPTAQSWVTNLGAAAIGLGTVVGGAAIAIPKLKELGDTITAMQGGSSRMGKAVGGLASLLAGPWGLALAGATVAVGAWATAQGEAQQKVQALAAGVDVLTGKLTEAGQAAAADELTKSQSFGAFGMGAMSNMIDEADRFGVSLKTIAQAYTDTSAAGDEAAQAALAAADAYEQANPYSVAAEARATAFRSAVVDQRDRLKEATDEARRRADVNDEMAATTDTATTATEENTAATEAGSEAISEQVDALKELVELQAEIAGVVLSERDAQRQLEAAYDGVTDSIQAQVDDLASQYEAQGLGTEAARARAEAEVATADKLDVSTEAGRRNQAALDDVAGSTWDLIGSMQANGATQEQLQAVMATSRQRFLDAAAAMGMGADEANALADQLHLIPENVTADVDVNTGTAQAVIDRFITVNGARRITIPIDTVYTSGQAPGAMLRPVQQANGGVVKYFANGSENHVAQIAPAGAWRVWAEDETGGEAYIPLSPAKRPRSEAILEDVAARFGMFVGRYADGAVLGGPAGAGPSTADLTSAFRQALSGVVWIVDGQPIHAIAQHAATRAVGLQATGRPR